MPEIVTINVEPADAGTRLDSFICEKLAGRFSRSYISRLIDEGKAVISGRSEKRSLRLKGEEEISFTIPDPEKCDIKPENIPVEILYEDSDLAVINKPYGIAVHTGAGVINGTLVNALLYHLDDLSSIGGEERPGIVHRLDKDTAGLMVIAKNDVAHRSLSSQFAERIVEKEYCAIVTGIPKKSTDTIISNVGRHAVHRTKMTVTENGREAITEYHTDKVYRTNDGIFTTLRIKIHTGRTHQIRVHMSHMGNPVVGDPIYSKSHRKFDSKLMLAAVSLAFTHPSTGKQLSFSAELPEHMKTFIAWLEKMSDD